MAQALHKAARERSLMALEHLRSLLPVNLFLFLGLTSSACDVGDEAGADADSNELEQAVAQTAAEEGRNLPSFEIADETAAAAAAEDGCTFNVSTDKELMIRHLPIVEDPIRTNWTGSLSNAKDGAWHFGRLITNMAGRHDPSAFALALLQKWQTDQTVNGQVVAARPDIQSVIDAWPKTTDGKLDMTKPPLRLLAIVNRLDLRNLRQGNAGEGRFVFGVLDADGNGRSFTVIMEYKLLARSRSELALWAHSWHLLGQLDENSETYRRQLQRITDRFAGKNVARGRPNGSALSQLRTNEIAIGSPWELREFKISATTGLLEEVHVALTRADSLNGTTALRDFINENEATILTQTHTVPLSFQGAPFAAGASENNFLDFATADGINNNEARHLFSLNNCDGCHGGETGTIFLHINPRAPGEVAQLSAFLTGTVVNDPVSGEERTLNDLGRRNEDFANLLCTLR